MLYVLKFRFDMDIILVKFEDSSFWETMSVSTGGAGSCLRL